MMSRILLRLASFKLHMLTLATSDENSARAKCGVITMIRVVVPKRCLHLLVIMLYVKYA